MSDIAEVLRGLPYFSDLPQGLLDQVCRESERIDVEAETTIIEEDSFSEDMFVIVEGELRVTKQGTDREVVLATLGPGEVVGEIALLDKAPRTASVTTISPSSLIRIPANAFEDLIEDSRVVRRMFRTVTSRLRGIEDTLRHEERMAALGRMAAQLMHELNNPAAAVGRSMARAEEVYVALGDATVLLSGIGQLLARPIPVPEKPQFTDPLTRSSLEEGVATWLEELGVGDAWDIAPALVADGWDIELLQETTEGLDSETTTKFMHWLGLRVLASQLINEVRIAAGRISELVRVVKNYSYLDQGPVQLIDPTEGKAAKAAKIPYTIQAQPKATRTDADAIFLSRAGVPTGLISIPNRYMHSPNELISMSDVAHAIKLIETFVRRLDTKVDFTPR